MFLHDKPESSDLRFGHTVVSDWLAEEISKAQSPIRIAITGGLGTGKSTILKAALDKLKSEDKKIKTSYVDVWKLDKESVRRSAVIKIAKDLRPKDYKGIDEIKESAYGTRVENTKPKLFNVYLSWPGLLFSLFIGALIYFTVLKTFDLIVTDGADGNVVVKHLVSLVFGLLGSLSKLLDKSIINVQRTVSKSPMVGAEEFEECLHAILDSSELKNSKTILVFDNIDRASPSSSRAILAGISAFFDHSDKAKNVIIIVPFDPSCLKDDNMGERPLLDDCEKMFDAIIPLPKLTLEDLSDFAYDHLKKSLASFSYKEEQLRDLAYLVSFSPYRSPREIKHMVNQLMSKLSLARSLETKKDGRISADATLLPIGAITQHPECLLKFLICEKIYPEFTENLVENGLDVTKAFEADQEMPLIKNLAPIVAKNLTGFLQATIGIPKNPPQSAAAFLYMKGPDQVVSIPSGQAISDSIYMGDGEKLKTVVFHGGKKIVSDEDITSVIRYHRKKYAKNTQAIKNCIRALTGGLSEVDKFEKSLALEFCEILNLVPDTLREISPAWLGKVTNEFLETSSVNRVWKTIDAEFKASINPESIKQPEVLKWASECFVTACGQTNGLKRSMLNEMKLPLALLTEKNVVAALGDDYPEKYSTVVDTLTAVKLYLTEENGEKEDAYNSFVSSTFSDCKDENGSENLYKEITELWQSKCNAWLTSKDSDQTAEKFSNVAIFWPTTSKGKPFLEQLKDWFVANAAVCNKKSSAGFSQDILDICAAFYMNGIAADGNINGIIHHALSQINSEGLKALIKRYQNQNSIWKAFLPHAKDQLIQAIDRNKFYKEILIVDSPIAKPIAASFQSITQKDIFLEALASSEILFDVKEEVKSFYTHCSGESRLKLLAVFQKYEIEDSVVKSAVESFITAPDKSNLAIIAYHQVQDSPLKLDFTNFAISHLVANAGNWNEKECAILEWVHLAADEVTDATLKDFIDRAIERGLQNGANDTVKKNCTDQILRLWEANHAFTEKSFKILKKSAPSDFDSRIESLAEKHNIKEGLLEMAGSAIDKVLGKE